MPEIVEGFSISHAAVLDGLTSADDAALSVGTDLYGVRNGNVTPVYGLWESDNDNGIDFVWSWLRYADIVITSGYISFTALQNIHGTIPTVSGTGLTEKRSMEMYREDVLNRTPLPILMRIPSRDGAGNPRRLDYVIYKAQFQQTLISGATYKSGLEVNYVARAIPSKVNELGVAFGDAVARIGRIVSGPSI